MFFKNYKQIFLICIFCFGCNSRIIYQDSCQIDEFVTDSYKISKGKFSILKMQGKEVEPLNEKDFVEIKDRIEEKDILHIEIFHPKRADLVSLIRSISQNIGFKVKNGKIKIPDLDEIIVKDLTLDEAKDKILKRYQEEIKDIEVFVLYKTKKQKKVEVIGLVHGSFPITGKTHLFDILAKLNIPSNANLFSSYILRDDKPIEVDFYKLLKQGDMSQNIVMKKNDKIYIADQSEAKLLILGEVQKQSLLDLPNGYISIKEAIAQVGGLTQNSDISCIQVIRAGCKNPKIYQLDFKQILTLPNRAILLVPGDIVYISSTPISDWNKFISQILPSYNLFDSTYKVLKNLKVID
ncbi:MAG: polysaccharide biosynthesis/export family protein [Parachlamydiales bacterium]|nr:polysaccharide biosynthesis/export family protein [Parachlamydiales bacterium]